ncbi:MAG: folate-binding protein [Limnohabitans sp.]|nr:folate-binding protein [Limnohabitans sp.]
MISSQPETSTPLIQTRGACVLPHLGVIAARGPEAAHFLHNQLTQDFLLLDMQQARLAAFCNAKGRMQASMTGFKTSAEEVLLVMRADLLAQTLKRLSMFVLRSKLKLSDASAEWTVHGRLAAPDLAQSPWQLNPDQAVWSVALYPGAGAARFLVLAPAQTVLPDAGLSLNDWLLGEILSGVGDVQSATFEAFVPQMLNYESVDGVNFKKGCYSGQEVVARSQFRGILKRRTYLVSSALPLQVGQEIFHSSDASQPAGQVVQAVSHPQHGHWALVCLQTSSVDGGELHPADTAGNVLTLHPLPYALRDDI